MDETRRIPAREAHAARAARQFRTVAATTQVIAAAVVIAATLRSVVLEPFNIPSESMLPTLLAGDYLFVAKWPYGISRYSLPLAPDVFAGRIGGHPPERGDLVVFKTPRDNRTDFIKRVVGLPGDRIRMAGGQIELNGTLVAKTRAPDFVVALPPGGRCHSRTSIPETRGAAAGDAVVCRYPRFVEQIGERRYTVLDQIAGDPHDDTARVTVPAGHVFVAGDNRDDSADSRLTIAEGGVGMVPTDNLIGRAEIIFFSTSGTALLADPASWFRTLRLGRIGQRL